MKIYTKKGDDGNTQLFGGSRVPKHHLQVECYGTIDELNSHLGLLMAKFSNQNTVSFLEHLQLLLFDVGSHLATDQSKEKAKSFLPKIEESEIHQIENQIDEIETNLEPLQHFILPSGSEAIAQAHICRTVCRRCERLVSDLVEHEEIHKQILPLLNRLSDYFFVLARFIAKEQGIEEIKWKPRGE